MTLHHIFPNTQMNTSSSDFTSGCESGWTQYFDKSSSSSSSQKSPQTCNMIYEDYFEQDKHNCYEGCEDLSMVSDASSGPRPYNDEECFNHRNECSPETINKSSMKKNRNGKVREKSMTQLDDTASSHSKV